jgi:hypothetical protein
LMTISITINRNINQKPACVACETNSSLMKWQKLPKYSFEIFKNTENTTDGSLKWKQQRHNNHSYVKHH